MPHSLRSMGLLFATGVALAVASWCAAEPYFHAFVGTDIGVYYEVAKRLVADGRLELFGNYWDHKPLLPFLAFAPFTWLDAPGAEFRGLRLGMLAVYAGSALLAMWASMLAMPRTLGGVAAMLASAIAVVALGFMPQIDERQSGILIIAGVCFEFASVMCLVRSLERRSTGFAIASGILAATAPFWRPTSIAAGVMILFAFLGSNTRAVRNRGGSALDRVITTRALAAAVITVTSWIALTLLLGSRFADVVDTLAGFNGSYGAYFSAKTPIAAFLTQRAWTTWPAIIGLASIVLLWVPPRKDLMVGFPGVAAQFALLTLGLSIMSRKMEPFYAYQFTTALVLAGGVIVANYSHRRPRIGLALGLLALIGSIYATVTARTSASPYVVGNAWCSNEDQATGAIARRLGAMARPGDTLWICGNRAPLYEQCRRRGISPHDWTVYDTPLFWISDKRFQAWIGDFERTPPTFIVRLDNAQNAPWVDASRFAARAARINGLIDARYAPLTSALEPATGKPWPYSYTFKVYALKERAPG